MSEERDDEPTLHDALSAAFDEVVDAPEPVAAAPEPTEGQPRAADGKFAPKTEGVQAPATIPTTSDQPAVAAPEAPQESIRPPASWSAQAKADFAALPAHIQQEVLKREGEVNKGFEERAAKLKPWEDVDRALAPVRSRLAMNGLNDAQYVQALVAADESLRGQNKVQAFAQLAQQYGVDLRQFGAPQQAGQQPQMAQLPPDVVAALQKIPELEQQLSQQQSAAQQAATAQTQAEIDTFAKDHLYFENVKPQMAALLQTGQASDLASAYDMACWARPDIRPLVMKEQADKDAKAAQEAAAARVGKARQAGGSITGSPAAGSAPVRNGPAPNIRDALAEAWDA